MSAERGPSRGAMRAVPNRSFSESRSRPGLSRSFGESRISRPSLARSGVSASHASSFNASSAEKRFSSSRIGQTFRKEGSVLPRRNNIVERFSNNYKEYGRNTASSKSLVPTERKMMPVIARKNFDAKFVPFSLSKNYENSSISKKAGITVKPFEYRKDFQKIETPKPLFLKTNELSFKNSTNGKELAVPNPLSSKTNFSREFFANYEKNIKSSSAKLSEKNKFQTKLPEKKANNFFYKKAEIKGRQFSIKQEALPLVKRVGKQERPALRINNSGIKENKTIKTLPSTKPFELASLKPTDRNVANFDIKKTKPFGSNEKSSIRHSGAEAGARLSFDHELRAEWLDRGRGVQNFSKELRYNLRDSGQARMTESNKGLERTTLPSNDKQQLPKNRVEIIPKNNDSALFRKQTKSSEQTINNLLRSDQVTAQKVVEAYMLSGLVSNRQEAQSKVNLIVKEKNNLYSNKLQEKLGLPLPSIIPALPSKENEFEKHIQTLVSQKGLEYAQQIVKIQGKAVPVETIFRIAMKEFGGNYQRDTKKIKTDSGANIKIETQKMPTAPVTSMQELVFMPVKIMDREDVSSGINGKQLLVSNLQIERALQIKMIRNETIAQKYLDNAENKSPKEEQILFQGKNKEKEYPPMICFIKSIKELLSDTNENVQLDNQSVLGEYIYKNSSSQSEKTVVGLLTKSGNSDQSSENKNHAEICPDCIQMAKEKQLTLTIPRG